MSSKIKIIIDENSQLVDISGDKIEMLCSLTTLFSKNEELATLIGTALTASKIVGESDILKSMMENYTKPPEEKKPQQSESEESKKES